MNLFEIILVVLLGVYVLSNLYFAISGRILAIKDRKEDLERRNKDEEYENQLSILTKRVGEVGTENHNLNMNLREYQVAYAQLKKEEKPAASYVEEGILDCLQLHGLAYEKVPARLLALPHYFAITEKSGPIEEAAEKLFQLGEARFLQDSKSQNYSTKHKLWLAGGVTCNNAADLAARFQPELIDVSSGIESDEIGVKDKLKMEKLFTSLRGA